MSLVPIRIPERALFDITALYVPSNLPPQSTIELSIRIRDSGLIVREFGAYLSLTDRVYGRVAEASLRSYAQTRNRQLRISEIRRGSIELVITETITRLSDAALFVFSLIFLRSLPGLAEATKILADAYKSFEEGRLTNEQRRQLAAESNANRAKIRAETYKLLEEGKVARANRKRLRTELKKEHALANLNSKQLASLVSLLEAVQIAESKAIPAASRFAEEDVESIKIAVRDSTS